MEFLADCDAAWRAGRHPPSGSARVPGRSSALADRVGVTLALV